MAVTRGITFSGFLLRLGAAMVLVFSTYNPTGYSFFHWVRHLSEFTPWMALTGILLLIGWTVYLRATARSMKWITEFMLCGILAVGISWSHIRRRMTGQVDVDEVEGDV